MFNEFDINVIYDKSKEKARYLMMPFNGEMEQKLLGRKYVVIFDDRLIIAINLESLEMKYCKSDGILSVTWRKIDREISVITPDGLGLINLDEFKEFNQHLYCMTSRKNRLTYKNTRKDFKELSDFFRNLNETGFGIMGYKRYHYSAALFKDANGNENLSRKLAKRASLVVYAPDGKQAMVYEGENALTIRDSSDNLLLQIDKLGLSMMDGILGLKFSPNSNLLLIWRHLSVQVFDIRRGKRITKIDLSFIPAVDVDFNDDNSFYMFFSDGEVYEYDIIRRKYVDKNLPKKLIEKRLSEDHIGAYKYFLAGDESFPISIIEKYNFETAPRKWLNNVRLYYSDDWSDGILFDNGDFFFIDDQDKPFAHPFFDFSKVLNTERMKDSTHLSCFLREKNDIFSELLCSESEQYLVLISRMLNSLIMFDKTQNKVVAAYKHPSTIIGSRQINGNTLEIISNQKPYRTNLRITFPEW